MSTAPFRLSLFAALSLSAAGCATTVGPGQVGVLWSPNGGTQNRLYSEGSHTVGTDDKMYLYDLRVMNQDETLSVIAANGLSIRLDASVRYHLAPDEVVALQKEIGPDYYAKILAPVLRSEARRVIGQYTPEEIYSTKRDIIEREVHDGLLTKIAGKHIVVEAVLIRDVELPEAISRAIDQKLQAEQDVQKMKYELEVAKSKADEQRIEAQGTADYNRTVASSLSPAILEFQRVQQLGQLATSTNAKTVVMAPGTGSSNVLVSAAPKSN